MGEWEFGQLDSWGKAEWTNYHNTAVLAIPHHLTSHPAEKNKNKNKESNNIIIDMIQLLIPPTRL